MIKVVNCVSFDKGKSCCTNKGIKKSFFGLGRRKCVKYWDDSEYCPFEEKRKKAAAPPRFMGTKPKQHRCSMTGCNSPVDFDGDTCGYCFAIYFC